MKYRVLLFALLILSLPVLARAQCSCTCQPTPTATATPTMVVTPTASATATPLPDLKFAYDSGWYPATGYPYVTEGEFRHWLVINQSQSSVTFSAEFSNPNGFDWNPVNFSNVCNPNGTTLTPTHGCVLYVGGDYGATGDLTVTNVSNPADIGTPYLWHLTVPQTATPTPSATPTP
jgi:hypothetical protein